MLGALARAPYRSYFVFKSALRVPRSLAFFKLISLLLLLRAYLPVLSGSCDCYDNSIIARLRSRLRTRRGSGRRERRRLNPVNRSLNARRTGRDDA